MNQNSFKKLLKAEEFSNGTSNHLKWIKNSLEGNTVTVIGNADIEEIIFETGERYEKEIIIDGCVFNRIIFRGGYFKKIVFRNGIFNGFVSIRGGTIENLVLLGGTFNHWLGTLDGIKNLEKLGGPADGPKQASEALYIKRFEIEGGTYVNNIWVSGGTIDRLEIKTVSAVKIHCKPNDDEYFDTKEEKYKCKYDSIPNISELILSRYSNKDNFIHISDIDVDTLRFKDFTNIGNITISKLRLRTNIIFENSDLGKTSFIDCDFSKRDLIFSSSKITEVALAGCKLPDAEKIKSPDEDPIQKKLALSQIKKVFLNMGDGVTATEYHANELITHRKTLKWKNWPEWLSLFLNNVTNRHGRSWWQAFWILFSLNAILYTLYCRSLGFGFDPSPEGWRVFWRNAATFPEFFNPIRKSDFLPQVLVQKAEYLVPRKTLVIDSIAKFLSAYLIYQLVAAFRKHGKKE